MKISHGEIIISPAVGTRVAGYGTDDVSVAKLDDLYLSALALDDGKKKIVILGFDLLGIQDAWIVRFRESVAAVFGGEPSDCILTCTHTHTGPNTRILMDAPEIFEEAYLEELEKSTVALVRELFAKPFVDTDVFFYSANCDENINRRYVGPENRCSFLPHRREVEKIADGICDKEIGGLFFVNRATRQPEYVIGNFAAHPLAGHAPGLGGLRISADFPGAFRDYIKSEMGIESMYISGACGDTVPRGHETGSEAIRKVGVNLACAAIDAMILAQRNPDNFKLINESLQSCIETRTYKVREHKLNALKPETAGQTEIDLDVQLVSIGDVCLIGVPGEMVSELGLEMKWHSPFRKTFILYCSTSYISYICHGNALVAGGYEAGAQIPDSRTGLKLVNAAIDGAYTLYERTFPDPAAWPVNNPPVLVAHKVLEPKK